MSWWGSDAALAAAVGALMSGGEGLLRWRAAGVLTTVWISDWGWRWVVPYPWLRDPR